MTKKAREEYSQEGKWPEIQVGEEFVVKYKGGKNAKEKIGRAIKYSGCDNPRVDMLFDDNLKVKEMGVHKGMLYRRKKPISPLFENDNDSSVSNNASAGISDKSVITKIYSQVVDMYKRNTRNRRPPDRLEYK